MPFAVGRMRPGAPIASTPASGPRISALTPARTPRPTRAKGPANRRLRRAIAATACRNGRGRSLALSKGPLDQLDALLRGAAFEAKLDREGPLASRRALAHRLRRGGGAGSGQRQAGHADRGDWGEGYCSEGSAWARHGQSSRWAGRGGFARSHRVRKRSPHIGTSGPSTRRRQSFARTRRRCPLIVMGRLAAHPRIGRRHPIDRVEPRIGSAITRRKSWTAEVVGSLGSRGREVVEEVVDRHRHWCPPGAAGDTRREVVTGGCGQASTVAGPHGGRDGVVGVVDRHRHHGVVTESWTGIDMQWPPGRGHADRHRHWSPLSPSEVVRKLRTGIDSRRGKLWTGIDSRPMAVGTELWTGIDTHWPAEAGS